MNIGVGFASGLGAIIGATLGGFGGIALKDAAVRQGQPHEVGAGAVVAGAGLGLFLGAFLGGGLAAPKATTTSPTPPTTGTGKPGATRSPMGGGQQGSTRSMTGGFASDDAYAAGGYYRPGSYGPSYGHDGSRQVAPMRGGGQIPQLTPQ